MIPNKDIFFAARSLLTANAASCAAVSLKMGSLHTLILCPTMFSTFGDDTDHNPSASPGVRR